MKQRQIKTGICLALFIPMLFMYPWVPESGWPDQTIVVLFAAYTWTFFLKPRAEFITHFEVIIWGLLSTFVISRMVTLSDTPLLTYYPFIYVVLNFTILISAYVYRIFTRRHRR